MMLEVAEDPAVVDQRVEVVVEDVVEAVVAVLVVQAGPGLDHLALGQR